MRGFVEPHFTNKEGATVVFSIQCSVQFSLKMKWVSKPGFPTIGLEVSELLSLFMYNQSGL